MARTMQIINKLVYAEHQYQQLMSSMYELKKGGIEVKFIVHVSDQILCTPRECYDYCARDIVENFVVALSKNQQLIDKVNKGIYKIYFPFYANQLKSPIYHELQYTTPNLFKCLLTLSENIKQDAPILKTEFKFGDITKMLDMVNTNKHTGLIGVKTITGGGIPVDIWGHINASKREQSEGTRFKLYPDSKVTDVAEVRFEYNNKEVGFFCLFAIQSTRIVLNEIYSKYFKITINL